MPRQDCQCLEGFEPVLRPDDDSRDAQEPWPADPDDEW